MTTRISNCTLSACKSNVGGHRGVRVSLLKLIVAKTPQTTALVGIGHWAVAETFPSSCHLPDGTYILDPVIAGIYGGGRAHTDLYGNGRRVGRSDR